jgi:hypothetical protein
MTINNAYHDVAVSEVKPEKTLVGQGFSMALNVSVHNIGFYPETFNITAYANATIIKTQTVTVERGASKTVTLQWNTISFAKANYIISAYAWPVLNERNTTDNTLLATQTIRVVTPGDADIDKDIDILDVVKVTARYGSKKGNSNYDVNVDWNDDGKIDILDVVIVTSRYGYKDP